MIDAYFIVLGLALAAGFLERSTRLFAMTLAVEWASLFLMGMYGVGELMPYADAVTFWALFWLLSRTARKEGSVSKAIEWCVHLSVAKLGLHLAFNFIAIIDGGWWGGAGVLLQGSYMWSLNIVFLSMALVLRSDLISLALSRASSCVTLWRSDSNHNARVGA